MADYQVEDLDNYEALNISPIMDAPSYASEEHHDFVRGNQEDSFCFVVKNKDSDPLAAFIHDMKNFVKWLEECRYESRENIRKS